LKQPVTGVVLCGGDGRRFDGRDKPLSDLDGRPLVAHVLERLAGQVDEVLISANRNLDRYETFGFDVLRDPAPGLGPLGGVLAATRVAANGLVFVCPGDSPLLAPGTVSALAAGLIDGVDVLVAHDGTRQQNLFMLLRRACRASIAEYLDSGARSVHGFIERSAALAVPFGSPSDYRNVNTPDQLAALEAERRYQRTDRP
jgi:molybdopterin-guanine dinucleotide biosynthesis protein A